MAVTTDKLRVELEVHERWFAPQLKLACGAVVWCAAQFLSDRALDKLIATLALAAVRLGTVIRPVIL